MSDSIRKNVEARRADLLALSMDLIAAPSENPPGDTRRASEVVQAFLKANSVPFEVVAADPTMPNIVATFDSGSPGPHLVMNGHLDTFPAGDLERWTSPPFEPSLREGKLFGRGIADMKAGLASLIVSFATAFQLPDLGGSLTLTVVSDEETMGDLGSSWLMANLGERVRGAALLSAEPSAPWLIRCGEKGFVWFRITATATGAHGSLARQKLSAIGELIETLVSLGAIEVDNVPPDDVNQLIEGSRDGIDRAFGAGATDGLRTTSMNVGTIAGGLKVNVVAEEAWAEIDVRIPIGNTVEMTKRAIEDAISSRHAVTISWLNSSEPSISNQDDPFFVTLRQAALEIRGQAPDICIAAPATDCRIWRDGGVPAAVYGPKANNVAGPDEYVLVDELYEVNLVHTLATCAYLRRGLC